MSLLPQSSSSTTRVFAAGRPTAVQRYTRPRSRLKKGRPTAKSATTHPTETEHSLLELARSPRYVGRDVAGLAHRGGCTREDTLASKRETQIKHPPRLSRGAVSTDGVDPRFPVSLTVLPPSVRVPWGWLGPAPGCVASYLPNCYSVHPESRPPLTSSLAGPPTLPSTT